MTDQERLETSLEYVAGTLEAPQAEIVRQALLRGDPAWAAAIAEAEAVLGAYGAAIDPLVAPASAKSALMKRVTQNQTTGRARPSEAGGDEYRSLRRTAQSFAAIAAIILFAVLINVWTAKKVNEVREQARKETDKALRDRDAQIIMLQDRIDREGRVIEALHSTNLKVVDLGSDQSKAIGRILVDQSNGTWHVFTTSLAPLASDKTYELWFITGDKKIPGPTFTVDAGGNAMITVTVPKDTGPIMLAAVTDEPAGGVQVPTGGIRLVGKMQ